MQISVVVYASPRHIKQLFAGLLLSIPKTHGPLHRIYFQHFQGTSTSEGE